MHPLSFDTQLPTIRKCVFCGRKIEEYCVAIPMFTGEIQMISKVPLKFDCSTQAIIRRYRLFICCTHITLKATRTDWARNEERKQDRRPERFETRNPHSRACLQHTNS